MKQQVNLESEWIKELVSLTENDDRLLGLKVSIDCTEKGSCVLKLRQGDELVHKATYPDADTLNRSFPKTFLYIISSGIKEFHNKRTKK